MATYQFCKDSRQGGAQILLLPQYFHGGIVLPGAARWTGWTELSQTTRKKDVVHNTMIMLVRSNRIHAHARMDSDLLLWSLGLDVGIVVRSDRRACVGRQVNSPDHHDGHNDQILDKVLG